MLRFKVFENGKPAESADLSAAYLIGPDNVPARAELTFANGEISCKAGSREPMALALMWPVPGFGRLMLETTRLMDRPQPYNLHVELARGRLVRISQKREDWGLFDFPDGKPLYEEVHRARDLFVEALTAADDVTAAHHADQAVAAGITAGARLGIFHADVFLKRRRSANQISRRPFGYRVPLGHVAALQGRTANVDAYLQRLRDGFDFAVVPFSWRHLEPREGENVWADHDGLVRLLRRHKIHLHGTDVVSFAKSTLPDWTYLWEGDYEQVYECLTKHLKRVLTRFEGHFGTWEIISGVHALNDLHFSFDQLMELTRMSAMMAKQLAPRATAVIGITLPWGEYYCRDARTIPPLLYADMVVRNGINFDAFGVEMRFGRNDREVFARDPMQISAMLDVLGALGKPLHVTVAETCTAADFQVGEGIGGPAPADPQAAWLHVFYRIALSKPFVESVVWQPVADDSSDTLDFGPAPQNAHDTIQSLRREIMGNRAARAARNH